MSLLNSFDTYVATPNLNIIVSSLSTCTTCTYWTGTGRKIPLSKENLFTLFPKKESGVLRYGLFLLRHMK